MGAISAKEIDGYEFDWLASDVDGHVALLSTAGGGYVPRDVLQDTDSVDAAINAILASAVSSGVLFAPSVAEGCENTWRMMAERGVFAFDADPYGGPYKRVAMPERPIRVEELAEAARPLVRRMSLEGLRFSKLEKLDNDVLVRRDRSKP
ncbi:MULTISPECIES: hypothetical protein [unclassified Corallococcus]|uniref:hypothetical protein n=1 Tax=unclassified Corallococcus TaxID=2685029 RepID=UPI001A8E6D73|nr:MULTISPECIES: hypothetical protein [unclassified Corallococcus]MBN9681375.1 hypothetical protein [Corallococcus sp. NCSPR001]WAS87044.1 hypothetical protein O0N60_08710 [Corallococcus sp. NCRR]